MADKPAPSTTKVEESPESKVEKPEAENEVILYDNPYTYEFLLKRINEIIKKNNTYASR